MAQDARWSEEELAEECLKTATSVRSEGRSNASSAGFRGRVHAITVLALPYCKETLPMGFGRGGVVALFEKSDSPWALEAVRAKA